MTTVGLPQGGSRVTARSRWRGEAAPRLLLPCGILSSVLYAAMTVLVAGQWEGYSSASQTISELSAVGAPTRRLWVLLGIPYTHLALGGVTVLLMLLTIGVGAAAFGRRFRLYSTASLVTLLAFGVLTFVEAPGVAANRPTPWIGVWERINIGVFLLWEVVLAVTLLRVRNSAVPDADSVSPEYAHEG